ncbi:Hypothetical protein NGAL_HAMBI2605_65530 [Neorhizobium galegae bv. orientalis]|nr:Hypothetical protein NGAL_HAMBI2605_65530 [Neorhizobium galegae bv. orientalis]
MSAAPSGLSRILSWAVGLVSLALLVSGVVMHGWTFETHQRFWNDIVDRVNGPMTFRFILQPVMAFVAALPDGINDARHGHSAFFWTRRGDPTLKRGRLSQGLASLARVVLLGISMDVIYQMRVFERFYPIEALVMAILLAVIPYFIFRPVIEWLAGKWLPRSSVPGNHGGGTR